MSITLNILLESIGSFRYVSHIRLPGSFLFSRMSVLTDSSCLTEPDVLYVGMLSDLLRRKDTDRVSCCVCLRDRIEDPKENEETMNGLLVINRNMTILDLVSHVQDLFYRISNWQSMLHRSVYEHRSLQAMLDASEKIIGNFISVSDASMALLAYTRGIPIDDPVSVRLIKKGYHQVETTDLLLAAGKADCRQEPDGIIINTNRQISRYDMASRVYNHHDTYYAQCVMTANVNPLTPGMLDLFRILTEELGRYLDFTRRHRSSSTSETGFLIDLIENNITNEDVLSERALSMKLPSVGSFLLFSVTPRLNGVMEGNRLRNDMEAMLSSAIVCSYQEQVLALCYSAERDVALAESGLLTKLEEYLSRSDARCGMSAAFDRLQSAAIAFTQAKAALKYGKSSPLLPEFPDDDNCKYPHIACFERNALAIMAGDRASDENLWRNNRAVKLIESLLQYDQSHGTSNVKMLYAFLLSESRAAKAGEVLFMHRNNMLYHMGRVEEILGINLESLVLKRELLDSFLLLKMFGFRNAGEEDNV